MRPPSLWQILIIVLIIVIIFGARKLPDVASSIGKSLKIFKKEVTDLTKDDSSTGGSTGADSSTGAGGTTSTGQAPRPGSEPVPPGGPPGNGDQR